MISIYDMACLSRFEERWLDPDSDNRKDQEEKIEHEYERSDKEWAERCLTS